MRDALPAVTDTPPRRGFICQACGTTVVTDVDGLFHNPERGSPQRFCSPACRQAAYRRRQADTAENTPRQYQGGRRRRLAKDPK